MNEIVLRTMKQIRSQRTKKPPRPVLREPRSPFGSMALIFIPLRMIKVTAVNLDLVRNEQVIIDKMF